MADTKMSDVPTIIAEIQALEVEAERTAEAARQARRRLIIAQGLGFGAPGIRDPEAPCEAFAPGEPSGDCLTDGHYLCDECRERATCEGGCGRRPSQCECPD